MAPKAFLALTQESTFMIHSLSFTMSQIPPLQSLTVRSKNSKETEIDK